MRAEELAARCAHGVTDLALPERAGVGERLSPPSSKAVDEIHTARR
jgi:hypothetical protein